jgi:hypothetical protein
LTSREAEAKSLHRVNEMLQPHKVEIRSDSIAVANAESLVDGLEEQHLLRIVKPFLAVELKWLIEMIGWIVRTVDERFVQTIFDQKLKASINESVAVLNRFKNEQGTDGGS